MSPPGPHHPNSFLLRAGHEPGIPVREAGALTRNAKGTPKAQPLTSVTRAPLSEVRGVRFTHKLALTGIEGCNPMISKVMNKMYA